MERQSIGQRNSQQHGASPLPPWELTDAAAGRDRLHVRELADKLEVHPGWILAVSGGLR